ncbi:unnamed protein product [Rhizoctonia solani]|uniref:Uncharacterized protein n=1 Tax=Rhizoctonia solani TaxID=456999 RepID=A0A8H3DJ62_9AGAM|nr:unnamed protein product [Rhizoctonia solani]
MSQIVDIPQELKDSLRKFRFARRNAGSAALVGAYIESLVSEDFLIGSHFIVKINKQKLIMEEVEQFDNISIEDLAEGIAKFLNM